MSSISSARFTCVVSRLHSVGPKAVREPLLRDGYSSTLADCLRMVAVFLCCTRISHFFPILKTLSV